MLIIDLVFAFLIFFVVFYFLFDRSDFLRWKPGRQGSGYRKLMIYSLWRIDCYLIHFPPGSYAPAHKDPVKGRHLRINFIKKSKSGGRFRINNKYRTFPIQIFRADKHAHGVTMVKDSSRWVLSFGFRF